MKETIDDFRQQDALPSGTMVLFAEEAFVIAGSPIGYSTNALIYPAIELGSGRAYALQEFFPSDPPGCRRDAGVIRPEEAADLDRLQLYLASLETLDEDLTQLRWEPSRPTAVLTEDDCFTDVSDGMFALLTQTTQEGFSAEELFRELCVAAPEAYVCQDGPPWSPDTCSFSQNQLLQLMRQRCAAPARRESQLLAMLQSVGCDPLAAWLLGGILRAGVCLPQELLLFLQEAPQSAENPSPYPWLKELLSTPYFDEDDRQILCCGTLLPEEGMEAGLFESTLDPYQLEALDFLIQIGFLQRSPRKYLTIHPRVRAFLREALSPTDTLCDVFLMNLWDSCDRYQLNLPRYRQISSVLTNAADTLPDDTGAYASWAGESLGTLGDLNGQLLYYQKASDRMKNFIETSPKALANRSNPLFVRNSSLDLATSYNNVAFAFTALNNHWTALAFYKKALAIFEEFLPPTSPYILIAYNNIAAACGSLGNTEAEKNFYEKVLKIREDTFSPQHSSSREYYDLGLSYQNLAVACGKRGEYDQALSYFLKAMKLWQAHLPDHPDLAVLFLNLGCLYSEMSNPQEALHYDRKSICILENLLPARHPKLAQAYESAGDACLALGDWSSARMYYQKALESTDSDGPKRQALQAQLDSLSERLDPPDARE